MGNGDDDFFTSFLRNVMFSALQLTAVIALVHTLVQWKTFSQEFESAVIVCFTDLPLFVS